MTVMMMVMTLVANCRNGLHLKPPLLPYSPYLLANRKKDKIRLYFQDWEDSQAINKPYEAITEARALLDNLSVRHTMWSTSLACRALCLTFCGLRNKRIHL
eukprot:Selendium_serpulae@DN2035_c0_g1_i1.p2